MVEEAKKQEKKEEKMTETPKAEPKKEGAKAEKKEVSKKLQDILDTVEKMTVLELSELVKALEDKFGVTAALPMIAGAAAAGGGALGAEGAAVEEKTSFTVQLVSIGDKKIQVIKEVREISGLGLKEAKALVDSAPKAVKENVTEEEANKIKEKLTAAGAVVELK